MIVNHKDAWNGGFLPTPRWRAPAHAGALAVAAALALLAWLSLSTPARAAHRAPGRHHHASLPGADCQPYASTPCLLPFPDDRLTRADFTRPTERRVQLPAAAMPVNRSGERIAVGEYDRNDGFSPGSTVIVHVPLGGRREVGARVAIIREGQ